MIAKGFLWRTTTNCLLIFDYFLFATGNPSLVDRFLGGFFWIVLLAVAMIVSSYVPLSFRGREARPFYMLLSVVGTFWIVLYIASPYAADLAASRMDAQIRSFMTDPLHSKAVVSTDEQHLMMRLNGLKYDTARDAFIPTFRRMDYILTMENGEKYLLIMTISWKETPIISLRRVNTGGSERRR